MLLRLASNLDVNLSASSRIQMQQILTRGIVYKEKPSKKDPVAFFLHVLDGDLLEAVCKCTHVTVAWEQDM